MSYLNVDEVASATVALANSYPALCSLITLPHKSVEGRTCYALRLGTHGTPKLKSILFTACQHAREWGGAEISVYFAADLLAAYTSGAGLQYGSKSFTSADIQQIINDMEVFVFPCVNPDGRHYSQTKEPLWRKNRNPASGGGSGCIGVDLNRNYDILWNFQQYFDPAVDSFSLASTNPCSDLYHGPSADSEPEAKNIVWLLDTHPQIGWFMDIHSFTGTVLYPWSDAPNQTTNVGMNFLNPAYDGKRGVDNVQQYGEHIYANDLDTHEALAGKVRAAIGAVRGQQYVTSQSFYLVVAGGNNKTYPTSGTVDDYAYSRHIAQAGAGKIYSFTLEFGLAPTFFPSWAEMEHIILDVDAGLVEFCLQAQPALVKPTLPYLAAEVLFGVINDGGGVIIINGRPVPVPPWEPFIRDILTGMLIHQLASRIDDAAGQLAMQRDALRMIEHVAGAKAVELEQHG